MLKVQLKVAHTDATYKLAPYKYGINNSRLAALEICWLWRRPLWDLCRIPCSPFRNSTADSFTGFITLPRETEEIWNARNLHNLNLLTPILVESKRWRFCFNDATPYTRLVSQSQHLHTFICVLCLQDALHPGGNTHCLLCNYWSRWAIGVWSSTILPSHPQKLCLKQTDAVTTRVTLRYLKHTVTCISD